MPGVLRIMPVSGHRGPEARDRISQPLISERVLSERVEPPFGRPEPRIDPTRTGGAGTSFVRRVKRGLGRLVERREPHFDPGHPAGPELALRHALLSDWQRRTSRWLIAFVILSLLLHIGLLLALRFHLIGFGDEPGTIPVKLVLTDPKDLPPPPPPQPKPQPQSQQQQQRQQKPPPRGPLASDEFGDPNASGKTPTETRAPAAGTTEPQPGEAAAKPAENQSQTADSSARPTRPKPPRDPFRSDAVEEDQPTTPEQLATAGTVPPPPAESQPSDTAARPSPKPSPLKFAVNPGGTRRPTDRLSDPSHAEGHKAKYPGPDASKDEYLSYINELINQRLAQLPVQGLAGDPGIAVFKMLVRPNGSIVWFSLVQSSGDPVADRMIASGLNSIPQYPPLPAELREPGGQPAELLKGVRIADIVKMAEGR